MNEKHILTENGWLNARDPAKVLAKVGKLTSAARFRRLAATVVESVEDQLSEPICRQAFDLARTAASEPVTEELLEATRAAVLQFLDANRRSLSPAAYSANGAAAEALRASPQEAARNACWEATKSLARHNFTAGGSWFIALRGAKRQMVSLVRDVLGNPFRPTRFDASWRTPAVESLSSQMLTSGDFAGMPALANALGEAGCDDPTILAHCCGPDRHVRGCWVVDLVLARL